MNINEPLRPLYWADVLERDVGTMLINRKQAAAELRRLHEFVINATVNAARMSVRMCAMETLNEQLAEALEGLTTICEEHDAAVAAIMGKPSGWKDSYLNAARAALAKAKEQA